MATTDAKPGFRLPWSADRSESVSPADAPDGDAPTEGSATPQEIETPEMIDAASSATEPTPAVDAQPSDAPATSEASEPVPVAFAAPAAATRKPNKFMADLSKAMQAAAEAARADALARFGVDAKAHIEGIHASTASAATELRKKADDDVASVREWSKAEIARIREETDERITHRKSVLEREIEAHAAEIEMRIDRVQRRVAAFEGEMTVFFERLLAEDDPTRIASMAESLPEPPPFDSDEPYEPIGLIGDSQDLPAERAVVLEAWPESATEPEAVAETVDAPEAVAETTEQAVAVAETTDAPVAVAEDAPAPEAAASEAAAENAPTEAVETLPAQATVESPDGPGDDLFSIGVDRAHEARTEDPRLSALGLGADFAAAEAEAAAFSADDTATEEEIPVIADDALAARLAGLVPEGEVPVSEHATTRVTVTGLVSVASIAGFKRHLSRVAGVHSVGVSSGPDGEFVFAVVHDGSLVLRDTVRTLPGFGARVVGEGDGSLSVTARDPETEG